MKRITCVVAALCTIVFLQSPASAYSQSFDQYVASTQLNGSWRDGCTNAVVFWDGGDGRGEHEAWISSWSGPGGCTPSYASNYLKAGLSGWKNGASCGFTGWYTSNGLYIIMSVTNYSPCSGSGTYYSYAQGQYWDTPCGCYAVGSSIRSPDENY